MAHHLFCTTVIAGTFGSLTSTGALAFLDRAEGRSGWQPTNATSHWWHGGEAAHVTRPDWPHTGLGYATHHAATLFWALGFARWAESQPELPPRTALAGALATAAVAAAVDYGITPKRFTPGWEDVLTKRSIAVAYLAMAAGLAAGGLLARRSARS